MADLVGEQVQQQSDLEIREGRNRPRLRLACHRCQKRKIRCDGGIPACSNCRNVGVACTDGASLRTRELPRAHITALKNRTAWLESIIRARCPDVDLSLGASSTASGSEAAPNELSYVDPIDNRVAQQAPRDVDTADHNATAVTSSSQPREPLSGILKPSENDRELETSRTSAHQIGLIALGGGQDPRYIGPSSGYFLARVLLQSSDRAGGGPALRDFNGEGTANVPFPCELIESIQGPLPIPSTKEGARYLYSSYFDFIHPQYPILHEPTFMSMLDQMYEPTEPDCVAAFQVFMVLAIGASVCSRRPRPGVLGDSYGIAAMQYFDRINVENSLQGLQCLLLLSIYAIHNPSARLNIWYLNYHCIAALLDLGLQRNINVLSGISLFEQEMRTRLFWCVYTLDRTIATIMGRPIGLRDEACELRFPKDISDDALAMPNPEQAHSSPSHMRFATHLFALAKINSEIKYVANSIVRDAPAYALPTIPNINAWQEQVLQRLDAWADDIPLAEPDKAYPRLLCQVRYHNIRMLLMSPSPAIPNPSADALTKCYDSAIQAIRLYDRLYKRDMLAASWTALHSITISAISMIYCIRMNPSIATQAGLDVLMTDISICLSLLSAIGEHWSRARRCRDLVDKLAGFTIRWVKDRELSQQGQNTNGTLQAARRDATFITRSSATESFNEPCVEMRSPNYSNPEAQTAQVTGMQDQLDQFLAQNLLGEPLDAQGWMDYIFEDFSSLSQNFL
ncbi:fungal-specific transcription factor domain-containing protein [Bisporella sp. PMI_857]|nr:fungal-specific transcription factor domain-containing protein [Bisporella sp. PMI_857]